MPILHILRYNGSLVTWMVVSLTTAKFKPLIFSVSGFWLCLKVRVTSRLAIYCQAVSLGDKPLETHDQYFFFQLNTCFHSPSVTSSLMGGLVCRSQLLLVLVSAVIHRSESRGTHDHILLSQIRDSFNLEGQGPVFIFPRSRVDQL
jgi:hypothetical protein